MAEGIIWNLSFELNLEAFVEISEIGTGRPVFGSQRQIPTRQLCSSHLQVDFGVLAPPLGKDSDSNHTIIMQYPRLSTKVFSLLKGFQAFLAAGCAGKVSTRRSSGIARSGGVFNVEQRLEWDARRAVMRPGPRDV